MVTDDSTVTIGNDPYNKNPYDSFNMKTGVLSLRWRLLFANIVGIKQYLGSKWCFTPKLCLTVKSVVLFIKLEGSSSYD